jgi:ABC-type lipoprotein export system ATPase subunit
MIAPLIPRKKGLLKMNKLTLALKNCYGIKKLNFKFDFSQERVYALYAPNGVMKSSLAQTFEDEAVGATSADRIFPTRVCSRKITDENGDDLSNESILAVRPYDAEFGHSQKTSTLLLDAKLKKEYDALHAEIDNSKETLLKALKEQSHSKKPLEQEISSAFTSSDNQFALALGRIKGELQTQKDTPFADVEYDKIFDDKVLSFLGTKDVKTAIEEYVRRYNELLAVSTYFKKGTFDYYNASTIAKSLADNGFFAAKHTINLISGEKLEITTRKELEDVIAKEKDAILKDKELRKKFDEIAKLLEKNVTLRDFQAYLLEHEALLSQLTNIKQFKEDIWKSYLKVRFDLYSDYMSKYEAAQARKREIEEEATKQQTQWEEVIEIFNDRFFVPFELSAKNRIAVMLGYAPMIDLAFTYRDGAENVPIEKAALMRVLSTGERKALYILNVIFEIQTRKKANQETLMVVDDIADSFDYQNKYAIIQYLRDISQDPLFKQIIMTHNFDFFRTVESRFVSYDHCLMASKSNDGIAIEKASGIRNIFVNDLKKKFFTQPKKKIASIPFLRNLVEYTRGENDPNFTKLTSLLHWKADSAAITVGELDKIYKDVCNSNGGGKSNGNKPVIEIIHAEAQSCLNAAAAANFENKVVLAIAIRIDSEQFMVNKINDAAFVGAITSHQTQTLFAKFKEMFPGETEVLRVLERVMLMTPENIHLNSFMYEPIIDMSDDYLKQLYRDVLALNGAGDPKPLEEK